VAGALAVALLFGIWGLFRARAKHRAENRRLSAEVLEALPNHVPH
jgi:hypothetical protein